MSAVWTGSTFEVAVQGPAHGGFCVARHEGRVIFVRHALPGERVRVRITDDPGKSFCRGEALEIIEASADRIDPLCPIAGPSRAGCCDFSHVRPAALRSIKATVVREQLHRIAGIEVPVTVHALGDRSPTGWRSRTRLAVDDDGRVGVRGFRSDRVVTGGTCSQGVPGLASGIADLGLAPQSQVQLVVDSTGRRHVLHLRSNERRARAVGRVDQPGRGRRAPGHRRGDGRRAAAAARASAAQVTATVLEGTGRAIETVAGRTWEIDASAFWQAHRAAPDAYSDLVAEWAHLDDGDTAWDLYCGAGVFAARLGEQVGERGAVWGVESAAAAVRDGTDALVDLSAVTLSAGRVEHLLPRSPVPSPRVVVLDPPRSGAGRSVIGAVCDRRPERVIHIGCDPAAFARDAGDYRSNGYRLERLTGFDAFPMTHHVEVVGLFAR